MTDKEREVLLELIEAASPFTSGDTVDETDGTIPLMYRLEWAIYEARLLVPKIKEHVSVDPW